MNNIFVLRLINHFLFQFNLKYLAEYLGH